MVYLQVTVGKGLFVSEFPLWPKLTIFKLYRSINTIAHLGPANKHVYGFACTYVLTVIICSSFLHSFIPSFIHSFIHYFIHSFFHSFCHSFNLSFIHSNINEPWFIRSLHSCFLFNRHSTIVEGSYVAYNSMWLLKWIVIAIQAL